MPEHTQKYTAEVTGSSNRAFGFVFSTFFLTISFYPLVSGREIRLWSIAIAAFFLVLAVFIPKALAPANRLWMKFGMILHNIVSPVTLGILFYLVVTPTGLLMRLFDKDPLRLRMDPAAETYWIRREPHGPAADSLNNQF